MKYEPYTERSLWVLLRPGENQENWLQTRRISSIENRRKVENFFSHFPMFSVQNNCHNIDPLMPAYQLINKCVSDIEFNLFIRSSSPLRHWLSHGRWMIKVIIHSMGRPAYIWKCQKGRFGGDCTSKREIFQSKPGDLGEIFSCQRGRMGRLFF